MEKNKKIDSVLKKLNLNDNSQTKLKQIASISEKASGFLEKVTEYSEKDSFEQVTIFENIDGFSVKSTMLKESYGNTNFTDIITLQKEDKRHLAKDLKFYTVETFKLENITQKQVVFTYTNLMVNFDKMDDSFSTKVIFNFDRKNALKTIEVKQTKNYNLKTTEKETLFSKEQVKNMLNNPEKNQSSEEMLF